LVIKIQELLMSAKLSVSISPSVGFVMTVKPGRRHIFSPTKTPTPEQTPRLTDVEGRIISRTTHYVLYGGNHATAEFCSNAEDGSPIVLRSTSRRVFDSVGCYVSP